MVLWNDKLLHRHPTLSRDECISFGCYLGFHPEILAEEREIRKEQHRADARPVLYPSRDRVKFYPNKYGNFPKVLESTVTRKLSQEAMAQLLTTRVTQKGKIVSHVRPWGWKPGSYKPFEHTPLGRRIMGLESWDTEDASLTRGLTYRMFGRYRQTIKPTTAGTRLGLALPWLSTSYF